MIVAYVIAAEGAKHFFYCSSPTRNSGDDLSQHLSSKTQEAASQASI